MQEPYGQLEDGAGEAGNRQPFCAPLYASLPADKETRADESRARLCHRLRGTDKHPLCQADNRLLEVVEGQWLLVRTPFGARTEKPCQGGLQARDPPHLNISPPLHVGEVLTGLYRSLQCRGGPTRCGEHAGRKTGCGSTPPAYHPIWRREAGLAWRCP